MAYTPELSLYHSRILRRIAWAVGTPMTKAHARLIDEAAVFLSTSTLICNRCRDRSLCSPKTEAPCPFSRAGQPNMEVIFESRRPH